MPQTAGSNFSSGFGRNFCCRLRAKTWIQIIVFFQILICGTMLTLGGTGVTKSMLDKWEELELESIDALEGLGKSERVSIYYPFAIFRPPPPPPPPLRPRPRPPSPTEKSNAVRGRDAKEDHYKGKDNMKNVSDLFLVVFSTELAMTFILQIGMYKGSTVMLYVYSGWSGLGLTILFVAVQSYGALFIPVVSFLVILFLVDIFSACAVYSHAKELSVFKRQLHEQEASGTGTSGGKYRITNIKRRIRPIQRITHVHHFNGNKL